MAAFTVGDFATDLSEIVNLLNGIADKLKQCDPDAEIDKTPGKTAICSTPVVVVGKCAAPVKERFNILDLVETVEGLQGWVDDVRARLANYDPATSLEDGLRPPSENT